jgi:hypothetical protein
MKAMRATLLLLYSLSLVASAQTHRYIDISADLSTMVNSGTNIQANGINYTFGIKNDVGGYVFYPTIVKSNPLPGHESCFRFFMSAHPGTTTPGEKMLVNLVKVGDPFVPVWGSQKTIGFEVMLGSHYQVQSQHMQLSEWWQGSPYGPPLEMLLIPGTTQWAIGIENNANNTQQGNSPEIILPGSTLKRDQWYHFAISVTPNYSGNGNVQVWLNGKLVINNSSYPIGYNPATGVGKRPGKPMNTFDVEVGMYRAANSNVAEIDFDDMRWGDTYEDVK